MQKYWKRFVRRMQRMIENVKAGSIADIAMLASGIVLILAIIAVFIFLLLPKKETVPSVSSESISETSSQVSEVSSSQSVNESVVNPFDTSSSSSSSSSSVASSSSSKASSSSKVSSSSSVASSSSAVAPSSSSSQASSSSSTPVVHTHTYGGWVRLVPTCEAGTEARYCSTCSAETAGHTEVREVGATTAHNWEYQNDITDIETGLVAQRYICSICHSEWIQYPTDDSSSSSESE